MAALTPLYWQAVSPDIRRLLTHISQQPYAGRFYLAGGTGLALQIGHRRSVDLDLFSEKDEVSASSRNEVIHSFAPFHLEVVENTDGNLLMLVDHVRIGFFSYGYPLIEPPLEAEGVNLASILDIGLMKCDALISRGSRKDFYDLYFVARRIQLDELLKKGEHKYPHYRDFALMTLESMLLFNNAERDLQPDLIKEVGWETIKNFFIQQAEILGRDWGLGL